MEWNGKNNSGNSGHYVVASRPPNADRLQRRPLITKPNRMGQPADAATCFQYLANPNPNPCQSAYKY